MISEKGSSAVHNSPVFADISPEIITNLLNNSEEFSFTPGQLIIKDGDTLKGLFIISEGDVQLEKVDIDTGKRNVLFMRGEGESLGEMSLIDKGNRSITVRAKTEVTIVIMDLAHMSSILSEDANIRAKIAINIAKILSKRLRESGLNSAK